ncbi:TetR family transcriptional regulator [Flavobacterium sp. 316]|uniref:TetR/AcrR family transcriptional regulator n=1 Tax=Flavobacterium sediminilitoris TaxID=2024526 RepID=A0ABY4HP14_9FLAO|nr:MULTISPECIES: TetR/AcrR family transcriptional regulator [Flavobacterium]KIX21810.1 TetR family transcriptional regulator [Flavobacterium sp. 316]UOX34371.1 TetR/AcrR family transcriptional regulator [Flavobacterium sediminilitoris]
MKNLLANLNITVNKKLYVKAPETSDLGKKIIQHSIILIHEIGFEAFTFKKLGERINSNESSIYRYFENKHKLLLYLCSWYWSWIEYKLVFSTTNISNPLDKLIKAITVVTEEIKNDLSTEYINKGTLSQIVISEFTKTFLTKEVDEENKEGFFIVYKSVINRLTTIIEEVNPNYMFSKTLASSIIEGSLHQHYLKDHFKTITNLSDSNCLSDFYIDLIKKVLV